MYPSSTSFKASFFLVLLSLFCVSLTVGALNKEKKKKNPLEQLSADGPYVWWQSDKSVRILSVDKDKTIHDTLYQALPKEFSLPVYSHKGEKLFNVSLHPIVRQEWQQKQAAKLFVLSDPHGNFECFAELLQANGVINNQYQWIFGKNQLVIIGDVFDRGKDVLPILWLIYKLEKEAQSAGGQASFLLGNHESLVLTGDMRYAKKKYAALAKLLGIKYKELFNTSSELGRWLASRNTMQLIGRYLFVHAGVSAPFYDRQLSIPQVNAAISDALFLNRSERKAHAALFTFVYSNSGPIWYRGMVMPDEKHPPLSNDTLQLILNRYNADRILVGHTIFPDISTFYGGRVIGINVDNKNNRKKNLGRGVLIEGKKISIVGGKGIMKKKLPLSKNLTD